MEKARYELYAELNCSKRKMNYMFIKQSNSADDLMDIKIGIKCRYILINNNHPLQVMHKNDFYTEKYHNLILECKMSKYCDNIKIINDDFAASAQIYIELNNAAIEIEDYFKMVSNSK